MYELRHTWLVVQKMMGYSKSKSVTAVTATEAGAWHAACAVAMEALWKHRPIAAEAGRSLHLNNSTGRPAPCKDAICALMSTRPSTTLADLLRRPLLANPFSTMRASLRR